MRWLRYEADGKTSYGILEGEDVEEVSGSPFDSFERTGRRRALASVTIKTPVVPPTFYAAGLNYAAHVKEAAEMLGMSPDIPPKPDIGYRAANALIAHEEPIIVPNDASEKVQYEGELVVVIGKKAKGLSEEEALSCVLGYSIGNDVSERTWQAGDRTLWRAKNTDTFKPMGPWIDTEVDLAGMETTVRVNGETTTRFNSNDMVFGVATYLSAMSRYVTLYPGDILWMGTDGVSPNLKVGDVVEVEISGIGILRNPLIAEV